MIIQLQSLKIHRININVLLYGKTQILIFQTKTEGVTSSKDWILDPKELESKFNQNTKALIVNNPNNPLGKVGILVCLPTVYDYCTILFKREELKWDFKNREIWFPRFLKSHFYFWDIVNFMKLWFIGKGLNRRIKFSRKLRNLQYNSLGIHNL